MSESDQHHVVFSPSYRKEIWDWLEEKFGADLERILREKRQTDTHPGAERLQELIKSKLALDGIRDAEDLYQLLVGTLAEDFWRDAVNKLQGSDE